jgi:uncharacterized protein YceK
MMKASKAALLTLVLCLTSTGCATYKTISATGPGKPKVYSGTRLNINAISGDDAGAAKFKVTPPLYPIVDLPFSFLLDTMMLPATLPIAAYESVVK